MKLKPMLKYELKRSLGLMIGFFVVSITFVALFRPIFLLIAGQFSFKAMLDWFVNLIPDFFRSFAELRMIQELDMLAIIFVTILGIVSFSPSFTMGQSLNVSRKKMFAAQLVHMAVASAGIAFVNSALSLASTFTVDYSRRYPIFLWMFKSYYHFDLFGLSTSMLDKATIAALRSPQFIVDYFLYTFCMSILFFMVGYLIGICFYRLTKGLRRRFVIVAPAFVLPSICTLLPIADYYIFGSYFTVTISEYLTPAYILQSPKFFTPYYSMLYFLVLAAVLGFLCWLLLRRLTVSLPDPPNRKFGIFYTAAGKQAK